MVGTLLLLHFVPTSYRYAPNFGYSAAAVGMSDRVESTVHKVGPSWDYSAESSSLPASIMCKGGSIRVLQH
jgi:hypothetical protein